MTGVAPLGDLTVSLDQDGIVYHDGDQPERGMLRLPMAVPNWDTVDGHLVVLLDPDRPVAGPDFTVEETHNVAAVGPHCEHLWTVDGNPDPDTQTRHEEIVATDDRLVTRGEGGRYAEIDPATGAILDRWPNDVFVVNGVRYDLDGKVQKILEFCNKTLVDADQNFLYCFDNDGQQLWRLELVQEKSWRFRPDIDDNLVYLDYKPDQGRHATFVVDVETGEILEQEFGPEPLGEDLRDAN